MSDYTKPDRFFAKWIKLNPAEAYPIEFPTTVMGTVREIYSLDRWRWNLLLGLAAIAAFLEPGIMWLLAKFINLVSDGTLLPQDAITHPYFIAVVVLFLIVLPGFDTAEVTVQNLIVNPKLAQRTRFRAMNRLTRQSMEFFMNEMAGRISSKAFDMGRASSDLMITIMTHTCYVVVFYLGTFVFTIGTHWLLALIMFLWGGVSVALIMFFTPVIARKSDCLTESYSTAMGRSVDILSNISLTKMFSRPDDETGGFMSLLNTHLRNAYEKNKVVSATTGLIYFWNGISVAAMIFAAVWLWGKGDIMAGPVAALLPLILRIRVQTDWLFMQAAMISENYGTVHNGIEVLQRPIKVLDKADAVSLSNLRGDISFENIRFSYHGGKDVFKNLNLLIPAGQKVGLVGPSGAGKTTLLSLLLRFYDLDGGAIKLDGVNIADVTQTSLRSQISVVTQEPALLNRSVLENLLYGRPDISLDEVVRATRQAAAHDFILSLKDKEGRTGYDAHVGERGVKLSGGQRQRIAIARLILKNAPIMLLDEATSALDSEIEAVVQEQIYPLMENRTVIAIAHRLSTVMRMDRLIVLDQGQIIEDGTHQELLELNGLYARLWHRQSQGFLPD